MSVRFKLLLFLNRDIHSLTALKLLIPHLKHHRVKIILSQKVGNATPLMPEIVEMRRIESEGVDKILSDLADQLSSEIFTYHNVNSEDTLFEIKGHNPDLIISIRFGQIFKQPLIDIPKLGVINLHSGILPDYRGVLATFWAIFHGQKKIGTTLHYITNSGIDNGDIIAISNEEIDYNLSLLQNVNKLYKAGVANVAEFLAKLERNEKIVTRSQQELGQGAYFSYPQSKEVTEFLKVMRIV